MRRKVQLNNNRKQWRAAALAFVSLPTVNAFAPAIESFRPSTRLAIRPPPGSGYLGLEDEESVLPDSYEPMMEYPGTMRPGKTPENMPFQDLPIGDDDPDPVPWPHFQQIEWHHQWEPPHEHAIPMEQFIDMHGRWASPELEASMRAGVRKNVQERQAESQDKDWVITDDEDDDDDDDISDIPDKPISLGDGIFGKLGSDADRLETAAAVSPDRKPEEKAEEKEDYEVSSEDESALDDFLLDLGLDSGFEDSGEEKSKDDSTPPLTAVNEEEDELFEEQPAAPITGTTATINVDDVDDSVGFIDDDDELDDGVDTIPLDDFSDGETLDTEDIFDEGGFDFDDGGDFDGGDSW